MFNNSPKLSTNNTTATTINNTNITKDSNGLITRQLSSSSSSSSHHHHNGFMAAETGSNLDEQETCLRLFDKWSANEQTEFVESLLKRMCHFQHGHINNFLKPMLQRDFITSLPTRGLASIAETILAYLDARSLCSAELVCHEWLRVIADGMLWKKLVERMVLTDDMWRGLSVHRGWQRFLFKTGNKALLTANSYEQHKFYKELYARVLKDKEVRLDFYKYIIRDCFFMVVY